MEKDGPECDKPVVLGGVGLPTRSRHRKSSGNLFLAEQPHSVGSCRRAVNLYSHTPELSILLCSDCVFHYLV